MMHYFIVLILFSILTIVLFIQSIKTHKTFKNSYRINMALIIVTLSLLMWLCFNLMLQIAKSRFWLLFFKEAKFVPIIVIVITFMHFSYYLYKREDMALKYKKLSIIVPIITLFSIITNSKFHLFRKSYSIYNQGGIIYINSVKGVVYWIHIFYMYAIILLSLYFILKSYQSKPFMYRKKERLIIVSVLFATISNFIYIFAKDYINLKVDLTPLFIFIPTLLSYYGFYMYQPQRVILNARNFIVESMENGSLFLDNSNIVFDANKSFLNLTKTRAEEILHKNIFHLNGIVFDKIKEKLDLPKEEIELVLEDKKDEKYIELEVNDVTDNLDRELGKLVILSNITKLKKLLLELEKISWEDTLTDTYNRNFFERESKRLDHREYYPLGLILGDVNGLKKVNDQQGHAEGDKLLQRVAETLKSSVPPKAILCRIGGDEFGILVPSTSQGEIKSIYNAVYENCSYKEGGTNYHPITLGSFIKEYKEQISFKDMFKKADEELYQNKLLIGTGDRDNNITILTKILQEKNVETKDHLDRVGYLARIFARKIEMTQYETIQLHLISKLHDIGKIMIPDHILFKPGPLKEEEWILMKEHAKKGYEIIKESQALSSIAEDILYHHERWDGTGYPEGKKGEEIPLISRIINIIDSFDVMISGRVYQKEKSIEEAMEEIKRGAGTQFDPFLSGIFIEMIEELYKEDLIFAIEK